MARGHATCCDKLRLLMWKHYLLKRRRIVRTIFEIFTPVALVGLLFVLGSFAARQTRPVQNEGKNYTKFPIDSLERLK